MALPTPRAKKDRREKNAPILYEKEEGKGIISTFLKSGNEGEFLLVREK